MHRPLLILCALTFGCIPDGETAAKESGAAGSRSGGIDCTEIGCADGFSGQFSPAFTAAGAYVFTLALDGAVSTCAGTLPFNDDFSCDGALGLTLSGTALPPSDQSLPGFEIRQIDFATLQLTVTRDGTEEASWTVTPTWDTVAPNGPECGPVCTTAGAELTWP